jgi:type IV pilus assembly protein PilQ
MLNCTKTILIVLLLTMTTGLVEADNLVNINVVNTEVRDVLTALSSVGGVSIAADDSVTGKITIRLNDVPFDTALDLVIKTKGLSYQRIGNVIVVATLERMNKSFGVTQIFKLNFAKADDVKKSLAAIVTEDRLKVDAATNSIVFSGLPGEIGAITQVLTELDIPYQQISLEAKVVAISKNATKDLGFDWQWSNLPTVAQTNTNTTAIGASTTNTTTVTRDYPGVISFGRNPEGQRFELDFQAKLSALISKGNAKILAKPNITTLNGREALILIGDKIPVLTEQTDSSGKTSTTVTYVDAGIKLQYTPRINSDGLITATVHTEVSSPTLVPEVKAYRITTRAADTNVRMRDGETMVIGGLIGSDESGGDNKIPGLSDLPILGALFKSTHTVKNETEVMIFLTAHIVKNAEKQNQ